MQTICLSRMKRRQCGRIIRLDPEHPLSQRLMMMGLHEGLEVRVLEQAPWGGPIAMEAGSFRLAVRRQDAEGIWLELTP